MHDIAKLRHPVRIDGKMRKVSTVEALLLVVRQLALQGNLRAFALQEELFSVSRSDDGPPAIRWIIPVMKRDAWEKMMALDKQAEEVLYSRLVAENETRTLSASAIVRRKVGQKLDPGPGRDR